MVAEQSVLIEGKSYTAVISDEPQALLAAKAAGRAVIGVEKEGSPIWDMKGIPYVIPDLSDATEELLDMVVRRYLGLPWNICRTERLLIRELTREDAAHIPEEEYGPQEELFRFPEMLELYCKNQYGFYEYGTWALVNRTDGTLIGLAGVSNPKLTEEMEDCLEAYKSISCAEIHPWLELGYHVFRPYRRRGYCTEAAAAIAGYCHEVLEARMCALIHKANQASRSIAKGLGMVCIMETDIQSSEGQLLYAESPVLRRDKADP